MRLYAAFLILLVSSISVFAQSLPVPPEPTPEGEARVLRYPDIHDNLVVFMYGGDLWTVPAGGGDATRLTSSPGLELRPKFSPDGSMIAFTAEYDGNRDVYVIPVTGGTPKRLTYHQSHYGELRHGYDNCVLGWTPDGKVLFSSWRDSFDHWFFKLYVVPADGSSAPVQLDLPEAGLTSFSPDGKKIAYNRTFRNYRTWKRYRGGLAQDIWVWDFEAKKSTRLTDWEGTDTDPIWLGDKVYYNSDKSGKFNIFEVDPTGGTSRQLTFHKKWDARWASGGPGGIVYQAGGYLYRLDPGTGAVKRIPVTVGDEGRWVRSGWEDVSSKVQSFNLSTTGQRAVFEARGDIFTVPAEKGEARQLTATSNARERSPVWSPDGKWVAVISDRSGEEELYMIEPGPQKTGERKVVQLTEGGSAHRFIPVWSPDSKKLAFADKNLKLWMVDTATKKMTVVDTSGLWEIRNYSFSPCGKWLAYTKPVQRDRTIYSLFLHDVDSGKNYQLTDRMTNEGYPAFDMNGKYLYVISGRDFNPRLGAFEMSYVYNKMDRMYLLTLQADEPSPLAPESDEEKAVAADDAKKDDKSKKDDKDKDSGEKKKTKIDIEGIGDRIVALSKSPGDYFGTRSGDSKVFWLSSEDGKYNLNCYDVKNKKEAVIAEAISGYDISPDGKKLIVQKGTSYVIADAGTGKVNFSKGKLDLSGLKTKVDYRAEWRQMFNEAWRQERDFFYDPNMHQVDWQGVKERYGVLIDDLSHRDDLNYVLGEMVSELATSHTYVGRGDYPDVERISSGLLGCTFELSDGYWRIAHILPGENWSSSGRSPLTEPGMNVSEGDYLLAIDGKLLDGSMNPYSLLENDGPGSVVSLTIGKTTDISKARAVDVRPIGDEQPLRYGEWVENNRQKVLKASDGKIGYLHIPNMGYEGLNEFVKRFYSQLEMDGLIIDVRYNGGGFVSQMILERLRRRVMGLGAPRNASPDPYPMASFNSPMVCLINQYSASDGDIFPHYFREYGLGELIGRRTWGGVIGIRGYINLMDGGYITRPEFSSYSVDKRWIMENKGVSPDIEVDNLPDDVVAGRDPQLEKAVEVLMEKMKSHPPVDMSRPASPGKR